MVRGHSKAVTPLSRPNFTPPALPSSPIHNFGVEDKVGQARHSHSWLGKCLAGGYLREVELIATPVDFPGDQRRVGQVRASV